MNIGEFDHYQKLKGRTLALLQRYALLATITLVGIGFLFGIIVYRAYVKYGANIQKPNPVSTNTLVSDPVFSRLRAHISVPELGLVNASRYDKYAFQTMLRERVKDLYGIGDRVKIAEVINRKRIDTRWELIELESSGLLPIRILVGIPPHTGASRKVPVIIVDDEVGIEVIAGLKTGKKGGRKIGSLFLQKGHPLLLIELKGFGKTRLPSAWGRPGVFRYYSILKSQGNDLLSIHIRDIYDAAQWFKEMFSSQHYGIVAISKGCFRAAVVALLDEDIDRLYLASGFSEYETNFFAIPPYAYSPGERLYFQRVSVLAALYDRKIRPSYGLRENPIYESEAKNRTVLTAILNVWNTWGNKGEISQHSHEGAHRYDYQDVVSFFRH